MLGRDVSVGKISFNPLPDRRARDLAIAQPGSETPLLTLAELDASAAWSSLFWFAPVVDRLTLREPKIAIVREDVTRFNFSDVQQRVAEMSAAKPEEPPKPDEGRRASRSTTCASRAARSRWTTRSPAASRWWTSSRWACRSSPPSAMPRTSTCSPAAPAHQRQPLRPDRRGAALREGAVLDAERDLLRPAAGEGADVWPMPLPFAGARAARFEPARGVRAAQDAPPKIRVVGDLGLRQFDLRDKSGAELASWSALTVSRLELEPIARQAYIGDVGLWAPQVHARRYENLRLNWQDVAEQLQQLGASLARQAGGWQAGASRRMPRHRMPRPRRMRASRRPACESASLGQGLRRAGWRRSGKAAVAAAAKPAAKPAMRRPEMLRRRCQVADAKAAEAKAAEPKSAVPAAGGARLARRRRRPLPRAMRLRLVRQARPRPSRPSRPNGRSRWTPSISMKASCT